MKKRTNRKWILWGTTLLVALGILWFSTQNGADSGGLSGSFTTMLLQLFPNYRGMEALQQAQVHTLVQEILRSAAHGFIFLCLGVSAALLAKQYPLRYPLLISLVACMLYGVWDELYQGLLGQGRTCELIDMIKDSAGAAIGTGIVWLLAKKTSKARRKNEVNHM